MVRLLGILRVKDHGMDVGAAVVKSREQKAALRERHDLIPQSRTDLIFLLQIAKRRLTENDRADGADEILIDLL